MTSVSIDGPYLNAEFDGVSLELKGGGYFKQHDGVFQLESSFKASNYISYHIEANVVSTIPVPASFYLFFTSLIGLLVTRRGGKKV